MRWQTLALIFVLSLLSLWFVWAQGEERVTIELKDAPIADAFDQLFRAAGKSFIMQPGVPKEQRLTMRLVDVPFEKALNFLCDLTGLKWEQKDGIYVISALQRPIKAGIFVSPTEGTLPKLLLHPIERLLQEGKQFTLPFVTVFMRCSKCGAIIQRTCPQCKRTMQLNWQFCPFDGTKLPPAPEKCPKCGSPLPKVPKPSEPPKSKSPSQ